MAYVRAAETIRDAFGCLLSRPSSITAATTAHRPRGHSSLMGALDVRATSSAPMSEEWPRGTIAVVAAVMDDNDEAAEGVTDGVGCANVGRPCPRRNFQIRRGCG